MSGYHLLFVFTFSLEVLAVASCQGGSGTTAKVRYVFGSVKYQYLVPEVVRLRGTVRKPESMDYIHGAKHDSVSVSCYGRHQ